MNEPKKKPRRGTPAWELKLGRAERLRLRTADERECGGGRRIDRAAERRCKEIREKNEE